MTSFFGRSWLLKMYERLVEAKKVGGTSWTLSQTQHNLFVFYLFICLKFRVGVRREKSRLVKSQQRCASFWKRPESLSGFKLEWRCKQSRVGGGGRESREPTPVRNQQQSLRHLSDQSHRLAGGALYIILLRSSLFLHPSPREWTPSHSERLTSVSVMLRLTES